MLYFLNSFLKGEKSRIFILVSLEGTPLPNPSDEAKLVEKILTNYSKAVRPAEKAVNPLQLDFDVRVIQVIDFVSWILLLEPNWI